MGGFAAGSIIEISTSIEHDSVCLSQVSELAQSGFLAYYYYDLFHHPREGQKTDPMHLVYSSIYTAKFLDSVNNGGCFQLDISYEDITDYFNPQHFIHIPDFITRTSLKTEGDNGQNVPVTPNPLDDLEIRDEEMEAMMGHLIEVFESYIHIDTFMDSLADERHLEAGVFLGKGIFSLIFGLSEFLEAVLNYDSSQKWKPYDEE